MAHQQPYQQPYQQQPYPYVERPRRRGLKRTIFGTLGIVANGVGLIFMPIVAGMIALTFSGVAAMELTPLEADGGTIESTPWSVYSVAVPAEDLDTVVCDFEGAGVEPTREVSDGPLYTLDGVDYHDVYTLTAGSGTITVQCEGTDSPAYSELGMAGTAISVVVGFALPVVLGLLSLALLIWGIIALVRSSAHR